MNSAKIRYIIIQTFLLSSLYFGFVQDIEQAKIIVKIFVTFAFIVGFIAFFLGDNNEILNKMAKKPSPAPAWMSLSSGIAVVIFLLYFEKWLMGGAYLFSLVMFMELKEKVSEIKTKMQKSDNTGEK